VNVTTPATIVHTPAEEGSTEMTTDSPELDADDGAYVSPVTTPAGGEEVNEIVWAATSTVIVPDR
jgi:hypothetical protein